MNLPRRIRELFNRGVVQGGAATVLQGLDPDGLDWSFRTGTRVDVGSWLGKRRLWALGTPGALLLIAAGRRPYAERIGFDVVQESAYNHVTGEVVLHPAGGVRTTRLRMRTAEGLELLERIRGTAEEAVKR